MRLESKDRLLVLRLQCCSAVTKLGCDLVNLGVVAPLTYGNMSNNAGTIFLVIFFDDLTMSQLLLETEKNGDLVCL
jgi:hypothetical protein